MERLDEFQELYDAICNTLRQKGIVDTFIRDFSQLASNEERIQRVMSMKHLPPFVLEESYNPKDIWKMRELLETSSRSSLPENQRLQMLDEAIANSPSEDPEGAPVESQNWQKPLSLALQRKAEILYSRGDIGAALKCVDESLKLKLSLVANEVSKPIQLLRAKCQLHLTGQVEDSCPKDLARYCSENCKKEAWYAFHRYECPVYFHIRAPGLGVMSSLTYTTICRAGFENILSESPPTSFQRVLSMVTHTKDRPTGDLFKRSLMAIFLSTCLELSGFIPPQTSTEKKVKVAATILQLSQNLPCNAYEVTELQYSPSNIRQAEVEAIGGAVCPTVALTNHSCENQAPPPAPAAARGGGRGRRGKKKGHRRPQPQQQPQQNVEANKQCEELRMIEKDIQTNTAGATEAKELLIKGHWEQAYPKLLKHVQTMDKFGNKPCKEDLESQLLLKYCFSRMANAVPIATAESNT
ncbi:unnamed protein product [Cyprideis torosa]|uniref:Uncharacterized protein n=1 Tax=Cyprideis torosa TaxID=163714 RepID=A0A7R8WCR9_9CRUS|nr:unnamed protein product [Cyprideis torosa]CAG0893691.1 unnamed protein product [Cyprideis torosa]